MEMESRCLVNKHLLGRQRRWAKRGILTGVARFLPPPPLVHTAVIYGDGSLPGTGPS